MFNKYLAVAVLCLSFTACKKKEENKAAPTTTEATKPAEGTTPTTPTTPAPGTTTTTTTTTTPTAGAVEIKSVDDYTKMGVDMMDKITAIFAAAGKDCDKLAADLTKFMDDNKGMKESAEAFEKANPDAKKALDEKTKPQMEKFMAAAGPSMEACQSHEGLKAAMAKMGD